MRFILPGLALALLGTAAVGQPAWADDAAPPAQGYVIVQQALSYLVTDPSSASTAQALMKVDEELAVTDQSGVNTAEVAKARVALQRGDTSSGRTLLQDSIAVAVSALQPAVGEETGTTVVVGPYVPRDGIAPESWIFLALSILVAVAGGALALRLRPREGLRDLSRDIHAPDGYRHHPPEPHLNGSEHNDH